MNMNAKIQQDKIMKEAEEIKSSRHLDYLWLFLIALTIINAAIAEQAEPSVLITLIICSIIILKARLVIDNFMELTGAHPYIYYAMNAYFYVFPITAALVWLYPEKLVALTQFVPSIAH
jgi:hypothetical protein